MLFNPDRATSEQHDVCRRNVINLAVQGDHLRQNNKIRPSKRRVLSSSFIPQEKPKAQEPDRCGKRVSEQRLLRGEFERRNGRIFCSNHSVKKLDRRIVVANLPKQVREENQNDNSSACPNPNGTKDPARTREK